MFVRGRIVALVVLAVAGMGLAEPVLIFNPTSRAVTADVEFHPVVAGPVVVSLRGKPIPSQAEDTNGDGNITKQDIIYTRLTVQPGSNWLEVETGRPGKGRAEISAVRKGDVLRVGWLELDPGNGRPLVCLLAGNVRKKLRFDLSTPVGEWSELAGTLRISNLPLRTRLDFVSKGDKPLQTTVLVYPRGRCEIETQYPRGVPPGGWNKNRHSADSRFVHHRASVEFPRPADPRFHWMTAAGQWYETTSGHPGYGVQPFFAGLRYTESKSGLGLFILTPDDNVGEQPWGVWCPNTGDNTIWHVDAGMYMTDARCRFALVRYPLASDASCAPPVIRDLYYAPQVYTGDELKQMIGSRLTALEAAVKRESPAIAATLQKARSALCKGSLQEAMVKLEAARVDVARQTAAVVAGFKGERTSAAVRTLLECAKTLLRAQEQDRARPRRFTRRPWGRRNYGVDRLIRADKRIAEAFQAAARAERFSKAGRREIAEPQVSGPGEVFRAGFGTCGGMHTALFDLKWGYDFFAPMIEIGIKNFHFQAIRWTTHGSPDGTVTGLEGWDRLFEAFDRAGATAAPQLQPWAWTSLPSWMKSKYADSLHVYETERAGVDGRTVRKKEESFVWMSPRIWGSVPSIQQGFADFCKAAVQRLKHHKSIVGWAVINEASASTEGHLSEGEFSVKGFHRYLRSKYETVDALNQAWGSRHATFEEVPTEAPRENKRGAASLDLNGTWRFAVDPKNQGREKGWAKPEFDDGAWKNIKVPGYWERQIREYKDYNGFAWYRRKAAIPAEWAGKVLRLHCAGIDDDAEVFVNGTMVARKFGFGTPVDVEVSGVMKPGADNQIAILVNDTFVDGGVHKPVTITCGPAGTPPPRFDRPQRQLDRVMYAQESQRGICTYHSRVVHEADPQRPAFLKEWNLRTPTEGPDSQFDSFIAASAHFKVVGCDMYKSMDWYPMAIDMLRSTGEGKPIWLMETHYYSPYQDAPKGLRMGTWTMAVRGLRSVYFWVAKLGYESDCVVNDFGVEVAKMQHELDALAPVLTTRRRIETAIYLPRDSQYLCDRPSIDQTWQQVWRMLSAINVPVDFVDDRWIERGKLAGYKCLLIPVSPFMRKSTAERISRWVEGGGSVVLWSGSAVYDYAGNILPEAPGWGLAKVCGARVLAKVPHSAQLELRGPLSKEIVKCDSGLLSHRLKLAGAGAALDDGHGRVALSVNRSGKGQAMVMALDIGQLFARADDEKRMAIARTVWALLSRCGVDLPVVGYQESCEAHLLEQGDSAWLVLVNFNGKERSMSVTTRPGGKASLETVYDALTLERYRLETTADGRRGTYRIPAYGVRVIKVAG